MLTIKMAFVQRPMIRVFVVLLSLVISFSVQAGLSEIPGLQVTIYDPAGRVLGTISPDPDESGPLGYPATRNTYNSLGLIKTVESGELDSWLNNSYSPDDWHSYANFTVFTKTEFHYDEYGRKQSETLIGEDGVTVEKLTQYSYYDNGEVQCTAVRMNPVAFSSLPSSACELGQEGEFGPDRVTKYVYNGLGKVKELWRAVGTPLEQKYKEVTYAGGVILNIKDANNNLTTYEYDDNWRLEKVRYPYSGTKGSGESSTTDYQQFRYDINGNLEWERKRSGVTFSYGYDNLNHQVFKDGPGTALDVDYTYDLRGLTLTTKFRATGQGVTNVFDGFGNLKSTEINQSGIKRKLTYRYDEWQNRDQLIHNDNKIISYAYDNLNRSTGICYSSSCNPSTANLISISYKQNGAAGLLNRANGASTVFDYDNAQRLKTFEHSFANSNYSVTHTFGYNSASQITSFIQSNQLYTNTEDKNRTGDYVVNGLNQYVEINGQQLAYDDNANLEDDGISQYTYDDENRLNFVITNNRSASLEYDPLGRLFKVENEGVSRYFQWDGDALVAEFDASGNLVQRYVHGIGMDKPLAQFDGSALSTSNLRFLHTDHLGSVVAYSNASGAVTNINTYDTFGIPGGNNYGRFGYTGQLWLEGLNLYSYKARMYSPDLGRFLQTDPVGYEDQMNLYAYVGNDPMNMVDPTGMCQQDANGNHSGVCAMDDGAASIVSEARANPNSRVSEVDGQLVEAGKAAFVQTGSTDISGAQVDGGVTEVGGANGETIVVTMDVNDVVEVDGVDTSTGGSATRDLTIAEVFEHEVAGHVQDAITGVDRGRAENETNAMNEGNEFRVRMGIKFKRTNYRGRVRAK